jgi:hypothetical protein
MTIEQAGKALADRKTELARWNASDQARATTWFGDASDATRQMLQQRVDKESALLKKMTIEDYRDAKDPKDYVAYVQRDDATHEVNVTSKFFKLPVNSARPGGESKVQTTLHELSHFDDVASTKDVEAGHCDTVCYGEDNSQWLARNDPALAQQNADNFGYWAAGP